MIKQIKLNLKNSRRIRSSIPQIVQKILAVDDRLWLAGGAMSAIINGTHSEDYDIFFTSKELKQDEFYSLVQNIEKTILFPHFTRIHVRFGNVWTYQFEKGIKIQLIYLNHVGPKEILESFDLYACQIAINTHQDSLYSSFKSLKACVKKELRFHKIEYPVISFKRFLKYYKKGYRATDIMLKDFLMLVQARILTYNLVDNSMSIESLWATYLDDLGEN